MLWRLGWWYIWLWQEQAPLRRRPWLRLWKAEKDLAWREACQLRGQQGDGCRPDCQQGLLKFPFFQIASGRFSDPLPSHGHPRDLCNRAVQMSASIHGADWWGWGTWVGSQKVGQPGRWKCSQDWTQMEWSWDRWETDGSWRRGWLSHR